MTDSREMRTVDLVRMKADGQKIVALTAYDALFAALLDQAAIDILLVGDSVHQVLGGAPSTLGATLDQMIYHGRQVVRGTSRSLVVIDLPFMSYQVSVEDALRNAGRVLKETGASAVKLEGGTTMAPTVAALVERGIPVMGHIGLTPQSVHALGGYRVQGREQASADRLIGDAQALQDAGVFAVVLELVPATLAGTISRSLTIPTIGIGAGPECDGQVLVLHDMLGLNEGFKPKFLKHYASLAEEVRSAAGSYREDVRAGRYPDSDHSFES